MAPSLPPPPLLLLLLGCYGAPSHATTRPTRSTTTTATANNKFGMGVYSAAAGVPGPSLAAQLPVARALAGQGGAVLLYAGMHFATNGNASSCAGGCVPSASDAAAIEQAYALGLRPVVRLAQWPRTIRDFADDAVVAGAPAPAAETPRRAFTALARAYATFAAALPLPPDGATALDVVVLNEPNGCSEWECSAPAVRLLANETIAPEVGACLRDILGALRALPRLRLSAAPTAYTAPASCGCDGSPNPHVDFDAATDLSFMASMLAAVPDVYAHADFFNSHSYPFAGAPFGTALGRAGATHYRAQLNASGRPALPVMLTETGWEGHNESEKAASIVAAFAQEWLPDARVEAVMPFLLTAANSSSFADRGRPFVQWEVGGAPSFLPPFNATRQLRCRLGVGGAC
jgi:hypothetical protein